ncbi:hypothetical protein B7P43_G10174 [Cryptotermes secundus]|uniref:Uncharacterized protein n=2 Tax=Cryptotermes secundus TaxID=105785 RepID=A0A2J7Q8L6_9NEOP|nr:hypothetical protein B7P43_G10174 [Cryptotermes secundus]
MNTLTPQGVETKESVVEPYDSNSFANEEPFSVGNNGVGREPLSDNDGRQVIQNNVTQNTSVREWRNYDWEKNEQSIAVPILTIIEGFSKQLRPHNSDEETDTADNTGSESDNFWSPYNRNDPEDDDGSPKNTFSVSLYSRDAHEDNPQASLYKLNNGMDTRYFAHGHDPSYYVGNPAGSAYMRLRREDTSQLCVVPCSPVNYIVQPYHYGYYDAASDHSYATGVQLPHLHLPQLQLPPVKFPDLHDISSPHPSVSFDGHGSHGSSSENAQGHNYVVTSNAHAGASQGGHHYGGVSYSHVKDPSSHMAYSLDTPLKYVQTSMVLKPPHPYKKIFPSMNNV